MQKREENEELLSIRMTRTYIQQKEEEEDLVSWCFELSQPLGVTLALNTNSNLSFSYSAHKSFNVNHNISTAHLFQTYKKERKEF